MKDKLKIGILREEKQPSDNRVALIPEDIIQLKAQYPQLEFYVQASKERCISDTAYLELDIPIREDLSHCDVLLGVKEVPYQNLIANKTYFFFSHTIKEQAYNQKLMQELIRKKIRMIDYETLTDDKGKRLIGFGVYAGMVGAHHALLTYGKRTQTFHLDAAKSFQYYKDMIAQYKDIEIPQVKILITGSGKVAQGAKQTLEDAGIRCVSPEHFLTLDFKEAVFTQLNSADLYQREDGLFDKVDFYQNPGDYYSRFKDYTEHADILVNCIYWEEPIPKLFEAEDISNSQFKIRVIADISCDILGSVPINIRASTIADPVYGIHRFNLKESSPFQNKDEFVDIMAVDNLPNELPIEASRGFSELMRSIIIPELLKEESKILNRAEICNKAQLSKNFEYLSDYAYSTIPS